MFSQRTTTTQLGDETVKYPIDVHASAEKLVNFFTNSAENKHKKLTLAKALVRHDDVPKVLAVCEQIIKNYYRIVWKKITELMQKFIKKHRPEPVPA